MKKRARLIDKFGEVKSFCNVILSVINKTKNIKLIATAPSTNPVKKSLTGRWNPSLLGFFLFNPLNTTKVAAIPPKAASPWVRSEEHTSELQSRFDLVCRLLLEKQKK